MPARRLEGPQAGVHAIDDATPLHKAAHDGHLEMEQRLIGNGASLNAATTDNGRTPLYIAAHDDRLDVVRCLIDVRAELNKSTTDNGRTALYTAEQRALGGRAVFDRRWSQCKRCTERRWCNAALRRFSTGAGLQHRPYSAEGRRYRDEVLAAKHGAIV
jgi:hypothetical protein